MASDALHRDETAPLLPSDRLSREEEVIEEGPVVTQVDPASDHVAWIAESRLILNYSAPLIGTYLLQYLYNLVTIFVISHVGKDELAAVSLGITTMNIVGFAIFEGMATSLDTLCAQAYGSGHVKQVGLHMQRMILLLLLVAVPIGVVWICSPWILGSIVPQKHLALSAGAFLRLSLIGVPGYALFEAGKRFVQAQGDFTAALIVLLICAPVNVLLNWLFVSKLQWGVNGAALAAALTNDLRPLLLLVYVVFVAPWTLQCWPGFTSAAFRNWGPMFWLSMSGAVMTLCEWFAFEILTFSTTYVSTAHLAAQTLLTTTSVLVWHVPFSASVAVSTRIGHLIGSGAVDLSRRLIRLYAIIFTSIGLLDMSLILALKDVIPHIFTHDGDVRLLAARAMPFVAIFQVFDATTCCAHGIIRGLGRQSIGAYTTFCINYIYVVPLALYLELGPPRLGLHGLWISLGSGLALTTIIEGLITKVMNWQRCVDAAKEREEQCP